MGGSGAERGSTGRKRAAPGRHRVGLVHLLSDNVAGRGVLCDEDVVSGGGVLGKAAADLGRTAPDQLGVVAYVAPITRRGTRISCRKGLEHAWRNKVGLLRSPLITSCAGVLKPVV